MRARALLAAVAAAALAVTLGAAGWTVRGSGSAASATAAHLDAQVPATVALEGGVTLTWTLSQPPPDHWEIVRATSPDGPWTVIVSLPGTATSYTDTTTGGPYYYETRPVLSAWVGDISTTSPTPVTPLPAVHLPLSDAFTLVGSSTALGSTQVGNQPWQALNTSLTSWTRNGTVSSTSYATTSTAPSSNPMLVVDAGTSDIAITARAHSVGTALYARVSDATTWLRVRLDETQSGSAPRTTWYYVVPGYSGSGYASESAAASACVSTTGRSETECRNSSYSRQVGGYTYTWALALEADNAGTVTQLGAWTLGGTAPVYIRLTANGSTLTAAYGSSDAAATVAGTVTSSFNQGATIHGVGLAASSYGVSTGVGAMTLAAP